MKCRAELKEGIVLARDLYIVLARIKDYQPNHPDNDDIEEAQGVIDRIGNHLKMREKEL